MKNRSHFVILLAAFFLLFAVAAHAGNDTLDESRVVSVAGDYKFTPQELKSLEAIKRAKEFEKELGLEETKNFKSFDRDIRHTVILYHLKTEQPFSYKDYRFFEIQKKQSRGSASEIAWLASQRGITEKDYDIDVYYPEAVAGGTPVTPAMLRASPLRLAYLVFHEDWHDNVDLPIHFEEASGNLIGFVAPMMLFNRGKEAIHKKLEEYSKFAEAINRCHDEISKLAIDLRDKKISRKQYLVKRRQCIAAVEKNQTYWPLRLEPIEITLHHTYTYYWPLIFRLYQALDCDLVRFVQVLKEVNGHEDMREPSWLELERDHFVKSREAEKRIEVYLERIIQKTLAEKGWEIFTKKPITSSLKITKRIFLLAIIRLKITGNRKLTPLEIGRRRKRPRFLTGLTKSPIFLYDVNAF